MNHSSHQNRWSPLADYALLLGSGAGAVASLATQNATLATVPMTALVAVGLLNRRRIDRYLKQSEENLANLEGQLVTEVSILTEQVSALPTPEAITQLQRSAMEHSDRNLIHFAEKLDQTKQDFSQRLAEFEHPDLSHLYQETAQLQDQYTNVCTTLTNLAKQIERLSHQPRMEAAEADVAQLRTEIMQLRVSLESLGSESKTAQATLQDAVRHLDRRLRQVPNNGDPNLIKGEVRELVKAVSDLVPRREFAALAEKFQIMQEGQESLRQTLDRWRSTTELTSQNGHLPGGHYTDLHTVQQEVLALAASLQQVEIRLENIAVPFDITAEIRGTTATYLSGLQWQLSMLEQQTQELMTQQQPLLDQPQRAIAAAPEPAGAPGALQWLMAFRGETTEEGWSAIDQALLQALDEVAERLVVVWPWSAAMALDGRLMERLTELLERGCRLEIGWCHPGDRQEGRLLKAIAQQWHLTTAQRQLLKTTLNQLLPLKQKYPDQFSFKILGTNEQFLVCDRRYAIVGVESLAVTSTPFSALDLRVKTTEAGVITQLLQRFEHPDVLPEDPTAYFNRAVTRYDLRDPDGAIADFDQVLRLSPDDAVTLNNRGLIWVEKKLYDRALDDFNQAISQDAYSFAARCNRGWLLMNQGKCERAITDFNQAIQVDSSSPIPYFYRGTTRQRQGDTLGAIADFSKAIQKNPQVAMPYCYRGAAYQRQGQIEVAIADLEMAASLLHAQGDYRALAQVTQALTTLKQATLAHPLKLHSA